MFVTNPVTIPLERSVGPKWASDFTMFCDKDKNKGHSKNLHQIIKLNNIKYN